MKFEIEIPEDDFKDRKGMYDALCEIFDESQIEEAVKADAAEAAARKIDQLYDNKEQLAQQAQQMQ